MPKVHRSPLSNDDMDCLQAMAVKANAHGRSERYVPLYVAIDVGDAEQQDGYLLVCWPALNSSASHCARLIFDYIAMVVRAEFGASMVATALAEVPDGPDR